MDEIDALRQQLSAAQFLVSSLQEKLQQAEAQYAAAQEFHHHHSIPQGSRSDESEERRDGNQNNVDPMLRVSASEVVDHGANTERIAGSSMVVDDASLDIDDHDDFPVGNLEDENAQQPDEPAEYAIPDGMALPPLEVRTIYSSLGEIKAIVETYALAQGWTAATKKRDRIRICMGCRSTPDCPYHVRAETCAEGARISASKTAHTCLHSAAVAPKRNQITRLSFLREEVPKLLEVSRETPTKDIQDAVLKRFGTRISLSQCAKVRGRVRTRRPAAQGCSRCGGNGHNKLTCTADA